MTEKEAIKVLGSYLGESDELDEAIDFAIYALERLIGVYPI